MSALIKFAKTLISLSIVHNSQRVQRAARPSRRLDAAIQANLRELGYGC